MKRICFFLLLFFFGLTAFGQTPLGGSGITFTDGVPTFTPLPFAKYGSYISIDSTSHSVYNWTGAAWVEMAITGDNLGDHIPLMDIIPDANNSYDLGSSSFTFTDVYATRFNTGGTRIDAFGMAYPTFGDTYSMIQPQFNGSLTTWWDYQSGENDGDDGKHFFEVDGTEVFTITDSLITTPNYDNTGTAVKWWAVDSGGNWILEDAPSGGAFENLATDNLTQDAERRLYVGNSQSLLFSALDTFSIAGSHLSFNGPNSAKIEILTDGFSGYNRFTASISQFFNTATSLGGRIQLFEGSVNGSSAVSIQASPDMTGALGSYTMTMPASILSGGVFHNLGSGIMQFVAVEDLFDAGDVDITDVGAYFTSTNVEGALQELGLAISVLSNTNVSNSNLTSDGNYNFNTNAFEWELQSDSLNILHGYTAVPAIPIDGVYYYSPDYDFQVQMGQMSTGSPLIYWNLSDGTSAETNELYFFKSSMRFEGLASGATYGEIGYNTTSTYLQHFENVGADETSLTLADSILIKTFAGGAGMVFDADLSATWQDLSVVHKKYVDDQIIGTDLEKYDFNKTGWDFLDLGNDVTMAFDDGTRTLTLTAVSSTFNYWIDNVEYSAASANVAITDTEGIWYIYFVGSTLTASQTPWSIEDDNKALVAYVYWDASNNEAIRVGNELHTWEFNRALHAYEHETGGTEYGSGLAISSITTGGDGDSDSHAQIEISNGVIWDEDIRTSIDDGDPQDLSPTAQIPIFYRSGATGLPRMIDATNFPVTTTGTGRAAWNEWTGSTWQLSEVDNNDFVLMHLYGSADIEEPILALIGQEEYNTAGLARAGAVDEIKDLSLGVLADLGPEWVPLYTLIVQTGDGYANSIQSRFVTTDEGDDYIDWREVEFSSSGTSSGDHGNLAGLSDDDHTQYFSESNTGEIAGMTAKTTPVNADIILIEDSEASNAKKKMIWSNLMSPFIPDGIQTISTFPASPAFGDRYSGVCKLDLTGETAVTITTISNMKTEGTYTIHFLSADDTDTVTWPSLVKYEDNTAVGTDILSSGRRMVSGYYDGTNFWIRL